MDRLRTFFADASRMPKGAKWAVGIGLILSVAVAAVEIPNWADVTEAEWVLVEDVPTPAQRNLEGGGSFQPSRMTISALSPNQSGEALFRVAGVLAVEKIGEPVVARCDVTGTAPGTEIARTPRRRAAWPRPSDDLAVQEVPDLLVVEFPLDEADLAQLPIRDSFRRYSDTSKKVLVDWDGFDAETQNWVWELPEGTGAGQVALGWSVVFRSSKRPEARIVCGAGMSEAANRVTIEARMESWPPTVQPTTG